MAIVIDPFTPADQSYASLLSDVALWMNRSDLGNVIPRFVTLAESRISRDLRIRKQILTTTITALTTTRAVALPTDWLELQQLSVVGSPASPLLYMTMDQLDAKYPEAGGAGEPHSYSIEADNIILGPMPDDTYSIEVVYYARFPSLATFDANWLYSNHPSIYLYACLREGCLFVKDSKSAAEWDGLYKNEVKSLQDQDDEATHSGSVLVVKTL
jgi:hypothetical protein